MTLIG